jgi:LppX_LprAFG lipoprotein
VFRVPRPAISLLAGLLVVVASACSSAASPTSVVAGATGGPGSAASPANPNDPNSIITAALSSVSTVKSFHIEIDASGSISQAALASADGGALAAGAPAGDIKLDGSSIVGDVDVANSAAHITATLPTVPVNADVILTGGNLYYKMAPATKYTLMNLGSLTNALSGSLPVAVPTPGASALSGVTDELSQLQAQMDQAGVTVSLAGMDQIGGQDAYHISVTIPVAKLNAEIAAAAASDSPAMTIDSASVDVWVYKSNSRPAKVEIKGASSALGNVDLVVTITNYDAPVTIAAPPASEIAPAAAS